MVQAGISKTLPVTTILSQKTPASVSDLVANPRQMDKQSVCNEIGWTLIVRLYIAHYLVPHRFSWPSD